MSQVVHVREFEGDIISAEGQRPKNIIRGKMDVKEISTKKSDKYFHWFLFNSDLIDKLDIVVFCSKYCQLASIKHFWTQLEKKIMWPIFIFAERE